MRAVCCFTSIRDETRHALESFFPGRVDYYDLGGAADTKYGEIIADNWGTGLAFAVVEHDIVIRADVADAFVDCPERYCAFPYDWETNCGPALGCTRFRAELLDEFPDAALNASGISWRQFDYALIRRELARKGVYPHVHLPPVEHLNPAKSPLLPPFNQMSLAEHLGALGFTIAEDGLTASHHGGESAFR